MKRHGTDSPKERVSFKELFRLYRQVKIPWVMLILVVGFSILMREASTWIVPYTSKIQMGLITDHGFLGGFIGFTLLYELLVIVQETINELTAQMFGRNVRNTVWRKILHLPMREFGGIDNQSLVSRVTKDSEGMYAAIAAVVSIISVAYGIWAAFRQMYAVYKTLALIMLSGIPMTLLSAWITGKMQYKVIHIQNAAISRMTNFFAERLPNLLKIKTTRMEDEEYRLGVEENDKRFRMEIKQESIFIFIGPIGTMAQYINEIILLVVASAMVRSGGMKQYQLVSLYNYFLLFMSNAFMLSAIWQNLKMSHGSGAVIGKLASTAEEDLVSGTAVSEIGTIRGNEIRFAYNEDRQILDGVSFTIPQGKITAIVGENGCGKSTLVKLLERFNVESSGTVEVDGKDLSTLNLHDWRESVGYLFQGNQIIRGTIRENIAYGVHRAFTEEELIDAAKQAKAYDFIMGKDDGFDTVISRFDSKVSGGEMQRIAIARMILKRPKLLIMDEATSGIDVVSEKEVMEALMNMMKNRTVIMVSHDFNLIRKADNLIVLKDGRIEAGGTYREVYETSPLLREFEAKSGC